MLNWQHNMGHHTVYPRIPTHRAQASTLDSVRAFPLHQRNKMVCVALNLRRSSLSEPWGVSLSAFDNRVVIGKAAQGGRRILQWAQAIPCGNCVPPNEAVFIPLSFTQGSTAVYAYRLRQNLAATLIQDIPVHHQILPGDLVIGVDGMETRAFGDLVQITTYLRHVTHVTLVVLRHADATSGALDVWNAASRLSSSQQGNVPFRAASAAARCWSQVFELSPQSSMASTPVCVPFTRQVTPESVSKMKSNNRSTSNQGLSQHAKPATSHQTARGQFNIHRPTTVPTVKKERKPKPLMPPPEPWRNPWFNGSDGKGLPYVDNWEFSPEDGLRHQLFLPPIDDFPAWLNNRKRTWKSSYRVYKLAPADSDEEFESECRTIPRDFWTSQGFSTFQEWRSASTSKWSLSYSWNKRKRQRIQKEREEVVHVSQDPEQFTHWLKIRRNQWRVLRRQRQRERAEKAAGVNQSADIEETDRAGSVVDEDAPSPKRRKVHVPAVQDMAAIDLILEQEEEERRRRRQARASFDLSFIFDASLGAPDDVVVHCLEFLGRKEHAKLLSLNRVTSNQLKLRNHVWRQLCPQHWVLPRRPRKPWHEMYFHKLKIEIANSQKRWDDLLIKCSVVLGKGDHVQKIEKLVRKGEDDFGFDINYVSPVVCERNSLLNLSVIHQRHKVVRWLLDRREPDIESYDRGHFTPLLNAAWAGDRQLVRLMMQRGADRTKIGFGHYSKALAAPDFKGLTAEGWARKRGFDEIAKLIRLGL